MFNIFLREEKDYKDTILILLIFLSLKQLYHHVMLYHMYVYSHFAQVITQDVPYFRIMDLMYVCQCVRTKSIK